MHVTSSTEAMVRGICLVVFGVVLIRSSKVSARLEGFEAGDKGIRRSLRYCSMFHSSTESGLVPPGLRRRGWFC